MVGRRFARLGEDRGSRFFLGYRGGMTQCQREIKKDQSCRVAFRLSYEWEDTSHLGIRRLRRPSERLAIHPLMMMLFTMIDTVPLALFAISFIKQIP